MKASVIVPAWGDTPYLEEVKARLAAQTLRDFEVVVVAPRGAVHARLLESSRPLAALAVLDRALSSV